MRPTVGSVPFLNARPLVWALEQEVSDIDVIYAWPSKLPALLESGEAQAILVSSIEALTQPERLVVPDCSIGTRGAVMSVRLFSKTPFDRIETLALDASSMTSNMLAKLVLAKMFDCRPQASALDPDGGFMLRHADACVLIGDRGLTFDGSGLYTLDLGEAWLNLTNLPFVWACWVGKPDITPELVARLGEARRIGEHNLAAAAMEADESISAQLAHKYLTTVFDYRLEPDMLHGLRTFGELLVEEGLVDSVVTPRLASSAPRASLY